LIPLHFSLARILNKQCPGAGREKRFPQPPGNPAIITQRNFMSYPINARRTGRSTQTLRKLAGAGLLLIACGAASASDAGRGIEQLLSAAQQDKRGVTLYVNGQTVAGAVLRIEPGQWVELKSQQASRIIVRLDRIDGVAQ
jgi:hypothetical protein